MDNDIETRPVVVVKVTDAGYEVQVRHDGTAWPKVRVHFLGATEEDVPPVVDRLWTRR